MKTQNINNMLFDKEFREQLRSNPQKTAKNIYNQDLDNVEYKVLTNTKNTTYVVLPSKELMLDLGDINAAGGCVSSAGSVSSFGTIGTVGGSLSTVFSAGTVGSAGSIKVSQQK